MLWPSSSGNGTRIDETSPEGRDDGGSSRAIYTPAKGAYRLRGRGEVDRIRRIISRTNRPLLEKGWVVATNKGGYVLSDAGHAALK